MQFPNIIKYKQAIQDIDSFDSLKKDNIEPVTDNFEPVFASGNFAVVFKMKKNKRYFALKCFLKDNASRSRRQKIIVDFLQKNPSSYFIDYQYYEEELWVDNDGGKEYPVSWMKWVNAPTLGEKIHNYCRANDRIGLKKLSDKFLEFALWILNKPFAHGDLKHDNLLIKPNGDIILVDYDGMFLPMFKGEKTNELGGKSYQHPKRNAASFNKDIDDFSILIIYASLLALSIDPSLYKKYNNGQNIIFDSKDFKGSKKSALIEELSKIPELKIYLNTLNKSLEKERISVFKLIDILTKNDNSISHYELINDLKAKIVELEVSKQKLWEDIIKRENKLKEWDSALRIKERKTELERGKIDTERELFVASIIKSKSKKDENNKKEKSLNLKQQQLYQKENTLKSKADKIDIDNESLLTKTNALRKREKILIEKTQQAHSVKTKANKNLINSKILFYLTIVLMVSFSLYAYKSSIIDRKSKAIVIETPSNVDLSIKKAASLFSLSLIYSSDKEYSKAIDSLTKAISIIPNNAEYYSHRGNYYYALLKIDSALSDYNKAISLDPNIPNGYYGKGNCYYEMDEYQLAINSYSNAISIDAQNANFFNNRGECYLYLGHYDDARADFIIALYQEPESNTYYDNLNTALDHLE